MYFWVSSPPSSLRRLNMIHISPSSRSSVPLPLLHQRPLPVLIQAQSPIHWLRSAPVLVGHLNSTTKRTPFFSTLIRDGKPISDGCQRWTDAPPSPPLLFADHYGPDFVRNGSHCCNLHKQGHLHLSVGRHSVTHERESLVKC